MAVDVAVTPALPSSTLDLGAARAAADAAVQADRIPSAVVGVADATGTLGSFAISGSGKPVTRSSIFFLASVTKPIVATAVMQLVDEGRLDLHAPLARYLPEFTGSGREKVTSWHVLTHTSGLPDLALERIRQETPSYAHGLRQSLRLAPTREPGTSFAYVSGPWFLLAEVIARLTDMPFDLALRRRLLDPLGMKETTFDPRFDRGRIAPVEGVAIRNRLVQEMMLRFMARAMLPGGGMFGTLDDLLRFGRALLPVENGGSGRQGDMPGDAPRVLSGAAIETMTTEQTTGLTETLDDGTTGEPRYALGWRKPSPAMPGSSRSFHHGGISGGRIWVDPEVGLVFCFLTNRWDAPDGPAFEVLAEVYRAWPEQRARS